MIHGGGHKRIEGMIYSLALSLVALVYFCGKKFL